MTESITVALITAATTLVCQILLARKERAKDEVARAIRETKLDDRLSSIEKKLDEHNGYAKKFAEVSTALTEIRKDIEYIRKGTDI